VPFGGIDSAPDCIEHGVSGADGVYKAYEQCKDFFTFGPGSTDTTLATGVSTSYWILTVLGIAAMIIALVGWVVMEDRKLKRQAAYLLTEGVAKKVHEELGPGLGERYGTR
jgi:hypothetical protein